MQTITCDAIRKHKPCYDPATKLPEDYSGTVVDFLKQEQVPAHDRIWVARFFVTDKTNRLFAVWCARQALALVPNPDPRSTAACDVAERFANGEATKEELDAAAESAWAAAESARVAAKAAAKAARAADTAAWVAAWAAAMRMAGKAADTAAWVARVAAESAADTAAWARAAESAVAASAESAAWAAESAAQINYLITLIEREEP